MNVMNPEAQPERSEPVLGEPVLGEIGRHWRKRAEATGALLLELERATEEVTVHAAGR